MLLELIIHVKCNNTKENIKYSTKKLGKVIEKNGYPIIDIENCIRRAFYKVNNLEKEDKQKFTLRQFIKVPAISHFLLNKVKRILKSVGLNHVNVIKQKNEKFSNLLKFNNKYIRRCKENCGINKNDIDCKNKNNVYKFTCKICQEKYIGMTNNTACRRFIQHKQAINRKDEKNALVEHFKIKHSDRVVSIEDYDFDIIKKCSDKNSTAICESKCIEEMKPSINRKFEINNSKFM